MRNQLLFFCTLTIGLSLVSCGGDNSALLDKETVKRTQCLNDAGWTFSALTDQVEDTHNRGTATVPGVVHTDLLSNGLIEDPFVSTNEEKYQWIGESAWVYKASFVADEGVLRQSVQELVFEGLDTYADVYLNGEHVLGMTDNMFVEWRIPVSGKLKAGVENHLKVVFHPAYPIGEKLAKAYPVKLPADNDKGEWKTSVFTRKAPYHFGWDWGPRFLTMGIWRPVKLEGYSTAGIENVRYVQQGEVTQDTKQVDIDVQVTLKGDGLGQSRDLNVIVTDERGNIYGQRRMQMGMGRTMRVDIPVTIRNPKLWWPRGMGEANLYPVSVIVMHTDGAILDRNTRRIGIRTIKLVQEPDSVGEGVSFMFDVNGHPCFIKGANYIPQDNFLPRVDSTRYKEQIQIAAESHMNMLRVWGGGCYENNLFYDLCDEMGIMVWQDFIFGCSFYPWNSEFLDNVKKEAVYNVRRLRNHPSIAIWCGNNEIDEAWHHWGYQDVYKWSEREQAMIKHGIDTLFRGVLAEVVAQEDPGRPYHPSSPMYGRGNPKSQIMGDVHYWGVFHDEEPFAVYKDKPGRFSNEYGFESLACYDTYREYFRPEDMKLYSEAMVVHQKNPKGYRVIEEYMVRDLPLLKHDFRTYVYLTQLLQAEGIKIAMEGHRSKRPWTMGSMYWQLNDCWPVTSWSSHDSRYRWKALQYYARRSFAPTILSFERVDSTATAVLWAMTDELKEQVGNVTLKLMWVGKSTTPVWDTTMQVKLAPNSNRELFRETDRVILSRTGNKSGGNYFMVAEGALNGKPVRAIYHFTPLKDLNLVNNYNPVNRIGIDEQHYYEVSYKVAGERSVEATIKAEALVKSVLFEAEALQLNPSDAYFDVLPGEEKTVTLNFVHPIPAIGEGGIEGLGIFVTTLNDLLPLPSERPIRESVK